MSMNTVPERLAALRAAMKANGVDVYLIPVGDPHSSEYLPDHYTSLTYFSGFHGENSNFVVTMTESAVWADGRYFVQAEKEIAGTEIQLMRMGEPGVPTAEEYCGKVLPEGGTLGLCGLTANCALVNNLKKELEPKHGSIKTLFLEDELWVEGRPARPATPAWILPKEYAGFSPAEKLEQLRGKLKEQGCTAQLVGKLDNLAWLLNLRAMDIECTPYAMAYCYVTPNRAVLFIDQARVTPEAKAELEANGVTLATLPLPASLIKLFSIFRSSGRLFWPIYYLLMLLTLVGLARLKGRWLLAGAALLAVVQVWDVSPGMVQRSAAMQQAMQTDAFPTEMESDFWQAAQQYTAVVSMDEIQDDALHLALFAADNGMTTNDPFAARYDETALAAQRETLLAELADGTVREDTLYLFAEEGAFLQAVEPVKDNAWCGKVTSTDGTCSWYVIAPGLQGQNFDALCTPYDENYPLRLADYTDALWNRGVLDETKQTVCFADSPFVRRKLEHASVLCADGKEYTIKTIDDHDAGWLMVTLDIPDATVLWDKELESK